MPDVNDFETRIQALLNDLIHNRISTAPIEGASTALSNNILICTYRDILTRIKDVEISALERGQGKYVKRYAHNVGVLYDHHRSYAVFRDQDGTYKAFIEPKSKFLDNTKRLVEYPHGAFKKCKIAFRIDIYPFVPC